MRVLRWIVVAVAILGILGSLSTLMSQPPTAVNTAFQESAERNNNKQRLGAVGLIIFWGFVIAIAMHFEKKSKNKETLLKTKSLLILSVIVLSIVGITAAMLANS